MDSIIMMSVGYIIWCCIAFCVARIFRVGHTHEKTITLFYVLIAAPMVIIEILTGKGTIR
ncbi:MAG: hypothetical protein ACJAZB_000119 [Psychrosphaera sp.]|jgi:hypothetical protein